MIQISWPEYAFIVLVLLLWAFMAYRNKLPNMQAFKDFADVINSAGGNILLLTGFTAWSLSISMRFFYYLLALPDDRLSKSDAIVTAGITFVTGSVFGLFAGALIKTLTGGKANGTLPVPDKLAASVVPANGPGKGQ